MDKRITGIGFQMAKESNRIREEHFTTLEDFSDWTRVCYLLCVPTIAYSLDEVVPVVKDVLGTVGNVLACNFLLLALVRTLLETGLLLSFQLILRPWWSLRLNLLACSRTLWSIVIEVVVWGAQGGGRCELVQLFGALVGYRRVWWIWFLSEPPAWMPFRITRLISAFVHSLI